MPAVPSKVKNRAVVERIMLLAVTVTMDEMTITTANTMNMILYESMLLLYIVYFF